MRTSGRASSKVIALLVAGGVCCLATLVDSALRRESDLAGRRSRTALVASLGLTDLSLFTEARYTRHPAMADLHSAFQDHPAAWDHFPTAAWVGPPQWGNDGE